MEVFRVIAVVVVVLAWKRKVGEGEIRSGEANFWQNIRRSMEYRSLRLDL